MFKTLAGAKSSSSPPFTKENEPLSYKMRISDKEANIVPFDKGEAEEDFIKCLKH
jgi:hypothetical protein